MLDARKVWTAGSMAPATVDLAQIARDAAQFRRKVARANAAEYVAGVLVAITFGAVGVVPGALGLPAASRVGAVLLAAAALFVMVYLRRASAPPAELVLGRGTLEVHRARLAARRDLLARVPRWYLAPFAPGFLLLLAGLAMDERGAKAWPALLATAVLGLGVGAGVAYVNARAARELAAQLDALPAVEGRD